MREKEREECKWGRGRERGGQSIQSGLRADSREPDDELKLMNHETMTQAKVGCLTESPQATLISSILEPHSKEMS